MSAIEQLHRALVSHLRANAAIGALVADRIYETPPADAQLPFVVLGQYETTPDDSVTVRTETIAVQISVFTEGARARLDAWKIGAALETALNAAESTFSLANYTVLAIHRSAATAFRTSTDPAQPEAHGVFRYSALLTAK
jgi:hypothetical protein